MFFMQLNRNEYNNKNRSATWNKRCVIQPFTAAGLSAPPAPHDRIIIIVIIIIIMHHRHHQVHHRHHQVHHHDWAKACARRR